MAQTQEEDLVIDYDDIADEPATEATVQNPEAEEEADDDEPLPTIDVDEWVDLEDRWEKDYFYVVFTDEELYQNAYGLYYNVWKDATISQSLAKQQVRLLKHTLQSMKVASQPFEDIHGNLIPILKSAYLQTNTFKSYLEEYKKALKLPYLEGQELLKSLVQQVYTDERTHPFILPKRRMETRLNMTESPTSAPKTQPEKPPKKPGKKQKKGPPPAPQPQPNTEPSPTYPNETRVVFATDELPVPLAGVLKQTKYAMDWVPSLYLNERVEWKPPHTQEMIPVTSLDWKAPSNIYQALQTTAQVPFQTVLDSELKQVCSVHELQVLLETHGFRLDGLAPAEHQRLLKHLRSLPNEKRNQKIAKTYVWKSMARTNILPTDGWMFHSLKEWLPEVTAFIETHRKTYENYLDLLEKHTDVWTQHTAISTDIYTLAMRIREGQLDIEEAANTLIALQKQAATETYVDFLKQLLSSQWNLTEIEALLSSLAGGLKGLNVSIIPEKRPILTEYRSDAVALQGTRTFLLEDQPYDGANGWTYEPESLEEEAPTDGVLGDTIPEKTADPDATAAEEIIWVGIESMDPDLSSQWKTLLRPEDSTGYIEIMPLVARMMDELRTTTELPLKLESVFEFMRPRLVRLSQLEQLAQAFPDLAKDDLVRVLEYKKLSFLKLSPAETERFKKTYTEITTEFKRTIYDQFLYALTWWVIQLQGHYIRNPSAIFPAYMPCMPVWAFYGTPMSSTDEKGIAKYLVCVMDVLVQTDASLWSWMKGIPEKKLLDRIYKNSQLDEFATEVAYLKQQWKDRWKEVARKEKELEIRLETLEKVTDNPVTYRKTYVEVMKRLPSLLLQQTFKKEQMVFPVANSCCHQPLNGGFEPFQDFKKAGLYEHRERLKGSAVANTDAIVAARSRFARVTLDLPPPTTIQRFLCSADETLQTPTTDLPRTADQTLLRSDWNAMVRLFDEPSWEVPLPTAEDAATPLVQLSTSTIRRAFQVLWESLQKNTMLPTSKNQWKTLEEFLQEGSFVDKGRLMDYLAQVFVQERIHFAKLPWMESYYHKCMALWKEWRPYVKTLKRPVSQDIADGMMDWINYAFLWMMMAPAFPVVKGVDVSWETPLEGNDLELLDPQWLANILERRFTLLIIQIKIVRTPSQTEIQDYYATMRERLKETRLAEYNSKTIEEIKEMQDAKRLQLKPIFDKVYSAGHPVLKKEKDLQMERESQIEIEGVQDFRAEAWNPDDMDMERL